MSCRFTGATVHFVDEKYDTGPILAQRVVPVRADDTPAELASRVLKEVQFYCLNSVARVIHFIFAISLPMLPAFIYRVHFKLDCSLHLSKGLR